MKESVNNFFKYKYRAAALVDIGKKRTSNQDEVILCPEIGFYAVSDGMGGLSDGGKTSAIIRQVLPDMLCNALYDFKDKPSPNNIATLLKKQVCIVSDSIYSGGNKEDRYSFGATLSGVWLMGKYAIFVNVGDSRGYLLPRYKRNIMQVTHDHNVAAILVNNGELAKEEACNHPSSSQLTRFIGMQSPALPEVFIMDIMPGDRILLCSDGLYGMIEDTVLPRIIRSSRNCNVVCKQLVDRANSNGGRDNISAVYIKLCKK